MINAFIYKNIKEEFLEKAGYFKPEESWNPLASVNIIDNIGNKKISKNTLIIYYPGAFGHFHKGHLNIVERAYQDAKKITDDFIIVIAPANTSYTTEKYGNFTFASNYDRYQQLLTYQKQFKKYNVVIDLNPMLNHRVDHNFTDLLLDFIKFKQEYPFYNL